MNIQSQLPHIVLHSGFIYVVIEKCYKNEYTLIVVRPLIQKLVTLWQKDLYIYASLRSYNLKQNKNRINHRPRRHRIFRN